MQRRRTTYKVCCAAVTKWWLAGLPLPVPKIWLIFHHGVKRPCDLSTSKWHHGIVWWSSSVLSIFSLLRPSVLDLGSGTEQTDGQTDDGHQCIMSHPKGAGHNNCAKCRCGLFGVWLTDGCTRDGVQYGPGEKVVINCNNWSALVWLHPSAGVMLLPLSVCLPVCLQDNSAKIVDEVWWIFEGVGCVNGNRWLDFSVDPDHLADSGNFSKEFFLFWT